MEPTLLQKLIFDIHFKYVDPFFLSLWPLQVSQHPQATVWTLCRMITPTGSNPCRRSQRWMSLPAPQCPLSPHTMAPSEPSSPTEPAGPLIQPRPRPTPPPSSTLLPRIPERLQSLSPGLHRSATECRHGPPLGTVKSEEPPTNTADESLQSY